MSESSIDGYTKLTELAYHFGPFLFAIIFIFFIVRFVAKELNEANQENQKLYANLSIVAWVSMLVLVAVSVYFWYLINIKKTTSQQLVSGVISGFRAPEQLFSPRLFIRQTNYNSATNNFDYEWIYRGADQAFPVKLSVDFFPDREKNKDVHYPLRLSIEESHIDGYLVLSWDRENARILGLEELVSSSNSIGDSNSFASLISGLVIGELQASDRALSYAIDGDQSPCNAANIKQLVCIKYVQRQLTPANIADFETYHLKRNLVDVLLSLQPDEVRNIFKQTDTLRTGDQQINYTNATLENLFLLAIEADGKLQESAVALSKEIDAERYHTFLERQLANSDAARRITATETILATKDTQYIQTLKDNLTTEPEQSVKAVMSRTLELLDQSTLFSRIQQVPEEKVRAILHQAFKLSLANTPYAYRGRSVQSGFNSLNFLLHLLESNQVINPQQANVDRASQLSGEMTMLSDEAQKQAGDVVFYNYGHVMLYLWEDQVIGMTPSGIRVQPLTSFGNPIRYARYVDTFVADERCDNAPLACPLAMDLVREYYNKQGEWAGVFELSNILNSKFEMFSDTRAIARVKYAYQPAPGSYEIRRGTDHRIFDMEKSDTGWKISGMRGYLSAAPLKDFDQQTAKDLVKNYIERRGEYSGLISVDNIISADFIKINQTTYKANTHYHFKPIRKLVGLIPEGEAEASFILEFSAGKWNVVAKVSDG